MLQENNPDAACMHHENMYWYEKEECCVVLRLELNKGKPFTHHQLLVGTAVRF